MLIAGKARTLFGESYSLPYKTEDLPLHQLMFEFPLVTFSHSKSNFCFSSVLLPCTSEQSITTTSNSCLIKVAYLTYYIENPHHRALSSFTIMDSICVQRIDKPAKLSSRIWKTFTNVKYRKRNVLDRT